MESMLDKIYQVVQTNRAPEGDRNGSHNKKEVKEHMTVNNTAKKKQKSQKI